MNANHLKGAVNEAKGKAKENVGHVLNNDKMAGEGIVDRVKGKVQQVLGDVKDAVKRGVDKTLDHKAS